MPAHCHRADAKQSGDCRGLHAFEFVQDEDGAREDWIELYNPTAAAVNLAGWRITDDPQDTAKWVFPSRTIAAGGYLVLFGSQKDRKPVNYLGRVFARF